MAMTRPDIIIQTLIDHGYEAYFVGGCVRDTLLGRQIHDWDITTSALPEQIVECFSHTVPTGMKHGTVTVLEGGVQAEVTTYRTDGQYLDGRHPDNVSFVRDLAEDLARRDFTVNAMAMDLDGEIVDLYRGSEDLRNKIIRCVGQPDRRFCEDALRMMRAFRFSAQLGFEIEENTKRSIRRNASGCSDLSAERIRDELEKILCSDEPGCLDEMVQYGLLERFDIKADTSCEWLKNISAVPEVRWAGLCQTWPELDLREMRLSRQITKEAATAAKITRPLNRVDWKILISEHGARIARIVAALEHEESVVEEILSSGECVSLQQLAVKGSDFPDMCGVALGEHLQYLLRHVIENPQDNRKEILRSIC